MPESLKLSDVTRENAILTTLDRLALVTITDYQGRIVYANEAFCRISGYQREELIGQDHRIINSGTQLLQRHASVCFRHSLRPTPPLRAAMEAPAWASRLFDVSPRSWAAK